MKYTVKSRNPDGNVTEKVYDASDRQDLFKQLSRAKVNAVSIKQSVKSRITTSAKVNLMTLAKSAVVIVLLLLFVGTVWLFNRSEAVTNADDDIVMPPAKPVIECNISQNIDILDTEAMPHNLEEDQRIKKLREMTPSERMEFLLNEAATKPIDFTSTTNRPFRTGTEQVLSLIFTTRLGDMPPILPKLPLLDEAHLAEILAAPNPPLDGDRERIKEAKEMVELAKRELLDYIAKGGKVEEFLEYYRGQLVLARDEWQESQKSVIQMIREDPEIAVEYIEVVNARLAEKGIKPVVIPEKLKEQLGID